MTALAVAPTRLRTWRCGPQLTGSHCDVSCGPQAEHDPVHSSLRSASAFLHLECRVVPSRSTWIRRRLQASPPRPSSEVTRRMHPQQQLQRLRWRIHCDRRNCSRRCSNVRPTDGDREAPGLPHRIPRISTPSLPRIPVSQQQRGSIAIHRGRYQPSFCRSHRMRADRGTRRMCADSITLPHRTQLIRTHHSEHRSLCAFTRKSRKRL
jgi:hypothetical protein